MQAEHAADSYRNLEGRPSMLATGLAMAMAVVSTLVLVLFGDPGTVEFATDLDARTLGDVGLERLASSHGYCLRGVVE